MAWILFTLYVIGAVVLYISGGVFSDKKYNAIFCLFWPITLPLIIIVSFIMIIAFIVIIFIEMLYMSLSFIVDIVEKLSVIKPQ